MGRMGEGQVVEEAGIPRHVCDKGHVREGGGRTDGLSIPWHLLLREIGGIKSLRRARSWEVDLTMTMTMTHSEKSRINRIRSWPYRQERRDHGSKKKNLFYW